MGRLLRDPTNKQKLFPFLSSKLANADCPQGKEIVVTSGVSSIVRGTDRSMAECDHEEADTGMFVHLQDALQYGYTNCLVCTVDTDILVILLGKFHQITSLCHNARIWVAFGSGKNYMHYDVNAIYEGLGREKCLSLPVFHCFTGCDTTSSFYGKGKKSAWEAWKCYPDLCNGCVCLYGKSSSFKSGDRCFTFSAA